MRKIAFGYSNRCNISCGHCVAADPGLQREKMDLDMARSIIRQAKSAEVGGISFTAGEPFIYFDDMLALIGLCSALGIYSRVVTNCSWADNDDKTLEYIELLRRCGLGQLRLSCSRWHQQQVDIENVARAAGACRRAGVACYVSFVTDFTRADDHIEEYLMAKKLVYFPEPLIYSGRAAAFEKRALFTDYQHNRCSMNAYVAPDLAVYACCDGGTDFKATNVFRLGSLHTEGLGEMLEKSESNPLFCCIRTQGISVIASYAGFRAREIVGYRKCDLCRELFDDRLRLRLLYSKVRELQNWTR